MKIILLMLVLFPIVGFSEKPNILVGVKESHPFVIQNGQEFEGISIDLAKNVLNDYNVIYKKYDTVEQLINSVNGGDVDIGVGSISITAARDNLVDYTHAYKSSELGVMYNSNENDIFSVLIKALPDLFKAVSVLCVLMLIGGLVYWVLERQREFSFKRMLYGMFNGVYWASATTTTVGYGDVSAKTKKGKVFSVIWMWASIFAMGSITATIVASVNQHGETGEFNLNKNVLGVIKGSQTQDISAYHDFSTKQYYNLEEMYEALINGKIDGIIHDVPLLDYFVKENNIKNIDIESLDLVEDRYAFVVPNDSILIKEVNSKMLKHLETKEWKKTLSLY